MTDAATTPQTIGSLDLSGTRTGWAGWRRWAGGGTGLESGWTDVAGAGGSHEQRIDFFARWFSQWLKDHPCELVVLETPVFGGGKTNPATLELLLGLKAFAKVICWRLDITAREVVRSEVTKATLGWCRRKDPETNQMVEASKDDVLQAINARHGLHLTVHDETDAIAALDLIRAEINGTGAVRKPRAEVQADKRMERAMKRNKAQNALLGPLAKMFGARPPARGRRPSKG